MISQRLVNHVLSFLKFENELYWGCRRFHVLLLTSTDVIWILQRGEPLTWLCYITPENLHLKNVFAVGAVAHCSLCGFSSHSELRGRGAGGLVGGSELCNPAQAAIVGFEMVPQHSDHAETPDEYWLAVLELRENEMKRVSVWFLCWK